MARIGRSTPFQAIIVRGTADVEAPAVLTAEQGSYTLTGFAAATLTARVLVAAQGAYILSGQAATVRFGAVLTAAKGTYTLSGQAAGTIAARQLTAAQGTYTHSGQAATLTYSGAGAKILTADQGSYTLSGQDAGVAGARRLTAAQGAYTLTGVAAGTRFGRTLVAAQGTYTLTGVAAITRAALKLIASQGSYGVTGIAAGTRRGFTLAAAQGSYLVTGVAAAVRFARILTAAQGAYTLTGQAANLTYAAAVQFLGYPIRYFAIAQKIAAQIKNNIASLNRVEIDEDVQADEAWATIWRSDRSAPDDLQRMSNGKTTRMLLRHQIRCYRYAMSKDLALRLRNTIAGDVEGALMINRELDGLCETSWLENGTFNVVPDQNKPGHWWGVYETDLVVDVTSRAA